MNRGDLKRYWLETAESDYKTMHNLYRSGDYAWSLFLGHLVIEKSLKALYVSRIDANVPKVHDLLRIMERIGIAIDDDMADKLDQITTFNLNVRYPDYKLNFYKKCTSEFAKQSLLVIEEVRGWVLRQIEQ